MAFDFLAKFGETGADFGMRCSRWEADSDVFIELDDCWLTLECDPVNCRVMWECDPEPWRPKLERSPVNVSYLLIKGLGLLGL